MVIPCIDLMEGKVVQLVQGREKALEGGSPDEMLKQFAGFPVIQVIDLDAAIGKGVHGFVGIEKQTACTADLARQCRDSRAEETVPAGVASKKPRAPGG